MELLREKKEQSLSEEPKAGQEQDEETGAPRWVDARFVQRALDAEGAHVVVEAVHVREATDDVGEHHMSRVFRVTTTTAPRQRDAETSSPSAQRHFVLKTPPLGQAVLDMLHKMGFFLNEMNVLGDVLPRVQAAVEARVEGRFRPLWARCLLHEGAPRSFILMEDLTVKGYRVAEAGRGLGLRHSLVVLRELARFHAASRVLLEAPGGADVLARTSLRFVPNSENPHYFRESLRLAGREISRWEGDLAGIGRQLEQHATVVARRVENAYALIPDPEDFSVVAHGDFWLTNILFRYDADGRPVRARAVDWQVSRLGSPGIDLNYLFYACLSDDVSEHHEDHLLREYHVELSSELERLGCARRISLRELRAQMDASAANGLMAAIHILPMMKRHRDVCYDQDLFFRDANVNANLYHEPAYKRCMHRFLPRFHRLGILDS